MGSPNTPSRAMTSPETESVTSQHWSELFLSFQPIEVVYSALINQTFTTLDEVVELTYDTGVGTLANVFEGMMLFVGTSAGAHDVGVCRVRKAPSGTKFYINETSGMQFANNQYLTVVKAFAIWPRDLTTFGGITKMDWDIEYGTADLNPPFPVLGPIVAVIELTEATVDFQPVDPSLSYSPDGAAIVSYLYECPTASVVTDGNTDSPTFTFNTAGWHLYWCTVTDEIGRSSKSYRWVAVSPDTVPFRLGEIRNDIDSGDWTFEVTCDTNVAESQVFDRSLVVLWARDSFGNVGPIAGFENIEACGWVVRSSFSYSHDLKKVTFTVAGPGYWMSKVRSYPSGLANTTSPDKWVTIKGLTVDMSLCHLAYWASTISLVCDFVATGDLKELRQLPVPRGNLWEQLKWIAYNTLLCTVACTRYGQVFIRRGAQFLTDLERTSVPVVEVITRSEWVGEVSGDREVMSETDWLEVSGIGPYVIADDYAQPYFSHAPGTNGLVFGNPDAIEELVFDDQDECNFIAGRALAVRNNPFKNIPIQMPDNNRFLTTWPPSFLQFDIVASDTPSGFTSTKYLVPTRITRVYNHKTGAFETTVDCEMVVDSNDGVTYYPPSPADDNIAESNIEDIGFSLLPGLDTSFPAWVIPTEFPECADNIQAGGNGPYTIYWDKGYLRADNPDRLIANAYINCVIRSAAHIFPTNLLLGLTFQGDAAANSSVVVLPSGAAIVSGVQSPISSYEITGFRVTLSPTDYNYMNGRLLQSSTLAFLLGSAVWSSSLQHNDPNGHEATGLVVGNWYALSVSAGAYPISLVIQVSLVGAGSYDASKFGVNVGYPNHFSPGPYYDDRPNWIPYSSIVQSSQGQGTNYAVYFRAVQDHMWVRWYDPNNLYNYDGLGPAAGIANASPVTVRAIYLGGGYIQNVCAP